MIRATGVWFRKARIMASKLNPQQYPTLLTIPETAKRLRVSTWTVYQLIRNKELKTLTIASRRFVASDDMEKFINERKGLAS